MSSLSLVEGPNGVLAAWDTQNQVYFGKIAPGSSEAPKPIAAPGNASERKHPSVAANADGETILVWTEGTGWQKGGTLAWCIFDKSGKPTKESGRVDGGIPVWGLPTAVATPQGEFIVIH